MRLIDDLGAYLEQGYPPSWAVDKWRYLWLMII